METSDSPVNWMKMDMEEAGSVVRRPRDGINVSCCKRQLLRTKGPLVIAVRRVEYLQADMYCIGVGERQPESRLVRSLL